MTMTKANEYFDELNDIRAEIESLHSRLFMDDMDHLRVYGYEKEDADAISVEIALLEQKLGFMLRQFKGSKSRVTGLISLKDAVKNVRHQYGLC
jgi:hypothetical protein